MAEIQFEPIDTKDVDRWVGKPVGGGQLKEPVAVNDIRRWAQAMQNPNPLYYDERFAAAGPHGRIVGGQSFTICCDVGHGATPAIQGTIPGSHMLFGGDEWWFFGPRIAPGDKIRSERLCFDYKVTNTKFAGPTMFQRGDTTYINQRGELVARQRSTSIRYIVANAQKLDSLKDQAKEPVWTDEQLDAIDAEKIAYGRTIHEHVLRPFAAVNVGEKLVRRPLGPHTVESFATEWRAYTMTIWGSSEQDGQPTSTQQAGWLPEMSSDPVGGVFDPSRTDGLYRGPSRGHTQQRYAKVIGVPRGYGYGASMGSWCTDYVTNWAGEKALMVHSNINYRNPALVGDLTYLNGEVVAKEKAADGRGGIVTVMVEMATHTGQTMAKGPAEVRFFE